MVGKCEGGGIQANGKTRTMAKEGSEGANTANDLFWERTYYKKKYLLKFASYALHIINDSIFVIDNHLFITKHSNMKQLFFTVLFFAAFIISGSAQTTTVYTCGATTQAGTACVRKVETKGAKCWQHGGEVKKETAAATAPATTCGAKTKTTGQPCKNRVKGGGKCHLHKG